MNMRPRKCGKQGALRPSLSIPFRKICKFNRIFIVNIYPPLYTRCYKLFFQRFSENDNHVPPLFRFQFRIADIDIFPGIKIRFLKIKAGHNQPFTPVNANNDKDHRQK